MVRRTQPERRKRRADGEQSRQKILDAAAEIAGERGYEGTSIAAVRERCGLPPSSIYWHFKDKDDLIAAVIERSFGTWLGALDFSDVEGDSVEVQGSALAAQVVKALMDEPDFLRLGLMLTLERRPQETSARRKFLEVREVALARIKDFFRHLAPGLPDAAADLLATYAMAGADGLFIAHEIGGDTVDLPELFQLHATMLGRAAAHIADRR